MVWLAIYDTTNFLMYHLCNYGFVFGALTATLTHSVAAVSRE